MHGEISHELEVKVPASEVWEVYGTIKLANLLAKLLPAYVQKVEILVGDGGVGTILKITFPPGISVLAHHLTVTSFGQDNE